MVAVPEKTHTTAKAIYEWYEQRKEDHREHLGASLIGHHCDRYLWLTFRWAATPQFEGRLLRLFDTGKREETRVYDELKAIGIELYTEEDGKQIECRNESGHFGGSVDGVARGFPEAPKTWAVLEIKTMNDNAFKALRKDGVKAAKPQHYGQMQTYMGLLDLDRAMYIAVNKNTDDMHTEWVHFDKRDFTLLAEKANRIVVSNAPPIKLSEDPAFWQCKMCDMHKLCHQDAAPEVNCRTCAHSSTYGEAQWKCEKHGFFIGKEAQAAACGDYAVIPPLVKTVEAPKPLTPVNSQALLKTRPNRMPNSKKVGNKDSDYWGDEVPF